MFTAVREVCVATGAPMLAPKDVRLVIATLAAVLQASSFQGAATAQQVCRQCLDSAGRRLRQRDVTFLVRGMQMNGHVYGQGRDDEPTLSSRLVDQILFLCEREQRVLDADEVGHIKNWIAGAVPA